MESITHPPLVAIIVPCYNHANYLPDALESILNQTFQDWECVIVNDASPDNTIEVANKWIQKDCRFSLVTANINCGLAASRNLGIEKSRGVYILPLDADDYLHEQYLEKSIKVFNNNPGLKVVYSDVQHFGDNNTIGIRPAFTMKEFCYTNKIHCTAMYRREDYKKTAGYRTNMIYGYEDWDFWLQIIGHENEVIKIPEAIFYIRTKANSMHKNLTNSDYKHKLMRKQLIENNLKVIKKWAPELSAMISSRINLPKKLVSLNKLKFWFK